MHWSFCLLFLYIILSQHAFLTVFNDSSQLPAARAGDLGIFRLFAVGIGLLDLEMFKNMQANIESLVPGTVVLYKTNESENGLKLATVISSSKNLSEEQKRKWHAILHVDVDLQHLSQQRHTERAMTRELGILLRRWSDECACGENYVDKPRDFIKPVADIHGVLWVSMSWLGLPILLLHRLKIFLAGAGIAGGSVTLACSLAFGQHVSLYDWDLDTRGTTRRRSFIISCCLLCTVIAFLVYKMTVPIIGVTCTTVLGVFFFLYAGLHDVAFDFLTWIRESLEDEITVRVGGPAYFGWPVRGCASRFYSDDLSFAHAQGDGLSVLQLLRGRMLRWFGNIIGLRTTQAFGLQRRAKKDMVHSNNRGDTDPSVVRNEGVDEAYCDVLTAPLRCSLTRRIMNDPVVAADGYSYERKEIEGYLQVHNVSPLTGRPLAFTQLVPNNQLRNVIEGWRRQHSTAHSAEQAANSWKLSALDDLRCPITMSVMRDSVLTCDGHRSLPSPRHFFQGVF